MPYDPSLADRIRSVAGSRRDVTEKKMFGGIAFLLRGKLFCGIVGDDLMVRVGPERYRQCLDFANVRPMDFNGKAMKGYVFVGPAGCRTTKALQRWVDRGFDFVASMDAGSR
jgi:TfoX/Sxy family transcriptional regulator of competence genes